MLMSIRTEIRPVQIRHDVTYMYVLSEDQVCWDVSNTHYSVFIRGHCYTIFTDNLSW